MAEQLDVRGLSCPQPVLNTKNKLMRMQSGSLEVLTDSGTSRDNVKRAAEKLGWNVETEEKGDEFLLKLTK